MFFKKKDVINPQNVQGMAVGGMADDHYGNENELLHMVAEDLVDCISARDTNGVVAALRALMTCIQSRDEMQDSNQA